MQAPHSACLFTQVLCAMALCACGEVGGADDVGEVGTLGEETTEGTDGTGGATTDPTDASTSGADSTTGVDPTDAATSSDTTAVGDAHGLLNFTYYPETASGFAAELGMAGAWRTEPFTTDDFFAVQAWSLYFPPAPVAVDTLENNEIPAPYEWGKPNTWVTGGNALKLRSGDDESLACLVLVQDTFPVYLSDDAEFFDPACAPDPARWSSGTSYDLVAFGGEGHDDAIIPAAIAAPAALRVTSPDTAASLAPLDRASDLAVTWEAAGEAGDRIVIRVIDTYGQMISVHAADDGAYTIPAAELGKFAPGPATITIARERHFDLSVPAGDLHVVARYEVWADPDLF